MTENEKKIHKDEITGVETTGHEWDGIEELNNPAPRWWLWVFFLTVIWSLGYWVVYPAWPSLKGLSGYTQHKELKAKQSKILEKKESYLKKFHQSSLQEILNDPKLYSFAVAGGKSAFKDNCATCHGSGGQGGKGYPNLNDDSWLWGGTPEEIYQTLQYGIRSGHSKARISMMPAFQGILKDSDIEEAAEYVVSLSSEKEGSEKGKEIFQTNCAACHGMNGEGNQALGAPRLNDKIWLYAGEKDSIVRQVKKPRHGVMPNWKKRLDEETLRQLVIYVHSLGGGESQ